MIKAGVDLRGLTPQMAVAYCIASWVYRDTARVPCIITSGNDGKHGPNSLHYQGKALDLRIKHVAPESLPALVTALKAALGAQFDVVQEPTHLHVEFDPKDGAKVPEEA